MAQLLDTTAPLALSLALGYMILVRLLRYHRAKEMASPYGDGKRSLSDMTSDDAHAIMKNLQELEFPAAFTKARTVALLKVEIDREELRSQLITQLIGWRNPNDVETLRCYRAE